MSNYRDNKAPIRSDLAKAGLRVPPQNLDSEKALLGSIMLRPETMNEIVDAISPDAFYAEKHRIIYNTILELFAKNTPIDLLSLSSRLKEKNLLLAVGGASYLSGFVESVPSSTNAVHYAEIVQRKYMMRRLIEAASMIGDLGYEEAEDLDEILEAAEKKIFEVTTSSTSHKFIGIKDTLGEAWERLDNLHRSGHFMRGVPTGFPDLDNKLSGLQNSDLIIIAARPSVGKTALALDIARQAATKYGKSVGIFSLEMSAGQLTDRMLAAEARVDSWKLRTGRINSEDEFKRIRDAMDRLSTAPISIDDQPGQNVL